MMFKLLILSTVMMMTLSVASGQDCPIAGQERRECASSCNTTCSNYLMPILCPTVCVPNGCQCPAGSVINEQTNSCVVMENCPKDGLTCPNVTGPGPCIQECNNNSDCERDLLCCSNGCGRVCSESVEKCAAIQCSSIPICPDGSAPITDDPFRCCPYCANTPPTRDPNLNCSGIACPAVACTIGRIPPGECCTVCGCVDTDRQFVQIGDTFMNDCNTCTCDSDNSASCTEIACSPDCPIAGQERSECASACNTTCSNYLMPIACPTVCVVNGCQCPVGSVINDQTNSCVVMENCPKDGLTCPNVTGPGPCVIECNNNNDCERDLLCCSNGCGRVCSESVEKCAAILCSSIPICSDGSAPITDNPFRCCPYCAPRDDGGAAVVATGYTLLVAVCVLISSFAI